MERAATARRLSLRDNQLTRHILELLKQGITPHKIALGVAFGVLLGIAPVLGTTIVSCTLAALALRLNLVLIQIVNNLVYPFQLLLLIPFVQAGQWLFREPPMPLSAHQIVAMVEQSPWHAIVQLWGYTVHGVVAWLLFSAVAGPFMYFVVALPLKRIMRKGAAA